MDGLNFKYKIAKNFLTNYECGILYNYARIRHLTNKTNFENPKEHSVGSNTADTYFYADPLMETFLDLKRQDVEKIVDKKLYPTYSYWRMYTYGATLPKHSDRPSCEISCTINISDNSDWPIYMDDKAFYLEKGDACIYKGCDVKHHRQALESNHQAQVFLHYVDAEGKNKDWKYDKRIRLGLGGD